MMGFILDPIVTEKFHQAEQFRKKKNLPSLKRHTSIQPTNTLFSILLLHMFIVCIGDNTSIVSLLIPMFSKLGCAYL